MNFDDSHWAVREVAVGACYFNKIFVDGTKLERNSVARYPAVLNGIVSTWIERAFQKILIDMDRV